jgi:cytochrome c oxidase assembly protein subunit 11
VTTLAQRNSRVAAIAGLIVAGMVALAFASVPLYRAFCQATGFAGTTQRATSDDAPGAVVGKIVSVRFDANTTLTLPWEFKPEQVTQRVAVGARQMAFYTARNLSDRPITGRATFNVTPETAGQYFTKIQCFCFTEQTLKPGERVRMPVVFYLDPKILQDPDASQIDEITLSYTFYPVDQPKAAS